MIEKKEVLKIQNFLVKMCLKGVWNMKCERCNVEMEKYELEPPYATFGRTYYPLNSKYGGEPILGRSVYICSECGKIEFNVRLKE